MTKLCPLLLLQLLFIGCHEAEPRSSAGSGPSRTPAAVRIVPAVESEPVTDDPDDPSIWIHPRDPALSLVVGTNKVRKPSGGLVVFDLQGKILQTISGLDRPDNVDIQQGVRLGDRTVDIAVTTERLAGAVRIYSIDADERRLSELAQLKVFEGEQGDLAAPMGIAIYMRGDGTTFLIISRKSGPAIGYLWEYRVEPGPALTLVRKFGHFSGKGEIEAVAVDDKMGYVYYADESAGLRKYFADPDRQGAEQELALFATSGYGGDREGIAIYNTGERSGYIVSTDQIEHGSRYFLYRREGASQNPHDHSEVVAVLEGPADSTDGIEVTSIPFTPLFPRGMFITMNSGPKNFLFFPWPDLSR